MIAIKRIQTSPKAKRIIAIECFLQKIKFVGGATAFLKAHEIELREFFKAEKIVPVAYEHLYGEVGKVLKAMSKKTIQLSAHTAD